MEAHSLPQATVCKVVNADGVHIQAPGFGMEINPGQPANHGFEGDILILGLKLIQDCT